MSLTMSTDSAFSIGYASETSARASPRPSIWISCGHHAVVAQQRGLAAARYLRLNGDRGGHPALLPAQRRALAGPTAEDGTRRPHAGGGSMLQRPCMATPLMAKIPVLILGFDTRNPTYGVLFVANAVRVDICLPQAPALCSAARVGAPTACTRLGYACRVRRRVHSAAASPRRAPNSMLPWATGVSADVLYGYAYFNAGWRKEHHLPVWLQPVYVCALLREWLNRVCRRRSPAI